MSDELQTLKNIENKISELLKWTKFAGIQQLKNVLVQALSDDEAATLAYELSDGSRGIREIAKLSGIGKSTVAAYWRKWSKIGIVEPSSVYQGRCQRICSLEEVGIPVPFLPQLSEEKQEEAKQEVEVDE
ncbi:MAG: hypothetical protein NWE95_01735 [Candidatus Bathyarchaeota archaeon]|nr:hypothetical protein [Candidatus Bathyarchaeota archaeon]